jgi:hypothetical protein
MRALLVSSMRLRGRLDIAALILSFAQRVAFGAGEICEARNA